ncbi:hypothetical protein C8R46DRAFT_1359489 [Mycena filopes]|nr:hypothetical protein C8R46DRAFT_1359489 [Mycena filopes]
MPFRPPTSPFASKLGTNYCPLDEELSQIRGLLVEPLSRLKELDGQIADLQRAMDELEAERDAVEAFIAPHKALGSPVRRLPLDIVQEIFVACLPTHRNCVMSAVEAPVLLGRICSAWRAISITTPRLWSRLHIVEPEPLGWGRPDGILDEKVAQRLETTKTWLDRSGQCPLSISFQGSSSGSTAIQDRFMQTIIPLAPRWNDITLWVGNMVLDVFSDITENDVPLLRRLEVSEYSVIEHSLALLKAPNLTELSFTGRHGEIPDVPVRWENLAHLSVGHTLPCLVALELLSRCPQLQVCSLLIHLGDISMDGPGGIVEVPLLHSLSITGFSPAIEMMFRRLSLPDLRHLDVQGQPGNMGSELQLSIEDFLVGLAVSSRLQTLRINTPMFTSSSIIQLFRSLPTSITCLHITDRMIPWGHDYADGIVDDEVIAALTPTPDNPGSCPALQELQIILCSSPSDAALLRFIEARMTLVSPSTLKKVAVKFRREKQVDIAADIQPLLNDGRLQVITSYTSPPVFGSYSPWLGLPDAPELLHLDSVPDFD